MLDKIKNTIRKYSMLNKGMKVLLAVSGGPDSVAMLYSLYSLRKYFNSELIVAHLNHQLRGRDSDKDEEYVRNLAKRLGLNIVTASENIKKLSLSEKLSLEDAARRVRYNFLIKSAKDLGVDLIATAHTKNDQAETVLMRLLRGAGLRGLRGISPKTSIGGCTIIRPLIDTSRSEIEAYLRSKKVRPRLDASNMSAEFLRNKIRLNLLPLLEKEYNPRVKESLSNIADIINRDYEYLDLKQTKLFKRYAKLKGHNHVSFKMRDFKNCHIAVQRMLARDALEYLKGSLDNIDYRHWREIEDLVDIRPKGSIINLPGDIEIIKTKATLEFILLRRKPRAFKLGDECSGDQYRTKRFSASEDSANRRTETLGFSPGGFIKKFQKRKAACSYDSVEMKIPGITNIGRKSVMARVIRDSHAASISFIKKDKIKNREEYFDMDKVRFPLKLRFRKPGDKMMPLGMKGEKKISDILIDKKVPLDRRDKIPVVVSGNNDIVWLCGIKMSDRYKISPDTKNILKLDI